MNTKQRLSNDLLNDGEIIIEKRFVKLYESEIDKIDEQISDLKKLDQDLKQITGVIEISLFYQIAAKVVVAGTDGIKIIES